MSKVRESVLQALQDIPDIVARAEVYIDIYRIHRAHRLNQATAALFKAILVSLRLILEYFKRKSLGIPSTDPQAANPLKPCAQSKP